MRHIFRQTKFLFQQHCWCWSYFEAHATEKGLFCGITAQCSLPSSRKALGGNPTCYSLFEHLSFSAKVQIIKVLFPFIKSHGLLSKGNIIWFLCLKLKLGCIIPNAEFASGMAGSIFYLNMYCNEVIMTNVKIHNSV